LAQASTLYRLSLERPKTDIDREGGFQQRDWPRIAEGVARSQKSIEPKSDRAGLRYFLNQAQKLPADQRIKPLDDAELLGLVEEVAQAQKLPADQRIKPLDDAVGREL